MCGIVGFMPLTEHDHTAARIVSFKRLFEESCVRGLHAYGIAEMYRGGQVWAHRSHVASDIAQRFHPEYPTIAHSRYCTSGDWSVLANNQPIVVDQMALAFNGVIHMGTKAEFEAAFNVQCQTDNDGEVFLRKLVGTQTPEEAVRKAEDFVETIHGSFAGAFLAHGRLIVSHNPRRPLWKCEMHGAKWFASTQDIFRRAGFVDMEPVAVGTEIA